MAGFMVMQVWRENARYARDSEGGEGYYPDSMIAACAEAYTIEEGAPSRALWFAQYTAPGYMDRTDPVYGNTAREAIEECFRLYGDDEDPAERSEYASMLWEARKLDSRKGA